MHIRTLPYNRIRFLPLLGHSQQINDSNKQSTSTQFPDSSKIRQRLDFSPVSSSHSPGTADTPSLSDNACIESNSTARRQTYSSPPCAPDSAASSSDPSLLLMPLQGGRSHGTRDRPLRSRSWCHACPLPNPMRSWLFRTCGGGILRTPARGPLPASEVQIDYHQMHYAVHCRIGILTCAERTSSDYQG